MKKSRIRGSNSRGFALLPPAPPRQLACFQESSFQDLGGSLIGGSEGFEGSIIRILLGSDALGSLILCILRGSEALRRSIICILCVPEPPGAQNWNSGGLEAAILDTFITSGGLEPPPHARHPHLEYSKCAQNHEFLFGFSRKQQKQQVFARF